MIISASRRTDIPAFFSGWFMNRIREQYALVQNPFNSHQISKVSLSPDVVDCFVFWSKNPEPMIHRLQELQDYMYYFQYTLNAYGEDLEKNLPPVSERISSFHTLSRLIGKQRVIWRYDPIILNETYTFSWHLDRFASLAGALQGCTERCVISFIDLYSSIAGPAKKYGIRELPDSAVLELAKELSSIARSFGMIMETCSEKIDLSSCSIAHGCCIDGRLISSLLGCSLSVEKDKNQRPECGCAASIDLGLYNTCRNGCIYCYANHSSQTLEKHGLMYDEHSPLLCGRLTELDRVTERKVKSLQNRQLDLFSRLPSESKFTKLR